MARNTSSRGAPTREETRIPVHEERLRVTVQPVDLGEVRLHKTVERVPTTTTRTVEHDEVEIERVNDDGSTRSLGSAYTSMSGEFTFRPPPGVTKVKVTAKYKGVSGSKEISEMVNSGIYRTAITLDLERDNK